MEAPGPPGVRGTGCPAPRARTPGPHLVRALVEHLARAGELVGVRRVLRPRGARPAGRRVSAGRLLGHVVGQAGAARAGRGRGASVTGETRAFYPEPGLRHRALSSSLQSARP